MAKKFTDKLKAKIGIGEKGAKNGPESAPKNEAAIEGAERAESGEAAQAREKKAPAAPPRLLLGWEPEIYDDTDVCRVLGWRRSKLAGYRRPGNKGVCWDVVGGHVGMTGGCVRMLMAVAEIEWPRWAEARGLKRIGREDGIWTVKMIRRNPNVQMASVEVIATGEVKACRVRDSRKLAIGEVFDCRMEGGRLVMKESLNTEAW